MQTNRLARCINDSIWDKEIIINAKGKIYYSVISPKLTSKDDSASNVFKF